MDTAGDTPGTYCPHCGEQRTTPKNVDDRYPNMYPEHAPDPHTIVP